MRKEMSCVRTRGSSPPTREDVRVRPEAYAAAAVSSGRTRTAIRTAVLPVAPCAPRSVYSCVAPPGVACGGGPRACRPSPRRCTCAARTRCGIPRPRRPIRPPSRCCSRRTCATGKYSGPSSWPRWPTCSGRSGCSAIPVTSRSATSTTPTSSSGSSPRR